MNDIWLWIIGVTAMVWPIVVANALQQEVNRGFAYEASCRLAINSALQTAEARIVSLQHIIEEQDKLVAALWAIAYHYRASEDEPFIYCWELYPTEAYGVSPRWVIKVYSDSYEENRYRNDKLSRVGDYPWKEQI